MIYLNLLDERFLTSAYYFVEPNDFIYIPPLKAKTVRQYQLTNITLILSLITAVSLIATRF